MTVTRKSPSDDINEDSPHIAELESGILQKNISASGNSNSDDDNGLINIDELLASMKESISTSVEPNSSDIAETDDNGTRDGSPVSSGRSTVGGIQGGLIVLFQFSKDFLLIRSQIRLY